MPDVLVRNVEASVLQQLKRRAKRQSRSLQSELNIILSDAAKKPEPLSELELVRKIRNSLSKVNKSDSVELIREDRNR